MTRIRNWVVSWVFLYAYGRDTKCKNLIEFDDYQIRQRKNHNSKNHCVTYETILKPDPVWYFLPYRT